VTALTDRVKRLRDDCVHREPQICAERAVIVTAAYRQFENRPISIKRALALAKVLDEMSVHIYGGELIVGNHSSCPKAAPVFPEFDVRYIEEELDQFEKRSGDRFLISEETKAALREIIPFWKGRTVKERILAMTPDDVRKGGPEQVAGFDNQWAQENGDGHLALDYPKLLRVGFRGLLDEARAKLAALDPDDPQSLAKGYFYQSLEIVYEASIRFANRFAALAEQMAESAADAQWKADLQEVASVCRRVPEHSASSFQEAVQVVWFGQLIFQLETNGHSVSIGRFDQFISPYYIADLRSGRLTQEKALEILQCFWVKLASITKLRSWSQTRLNAGHPMFQNMTVGGQTPDGDDAVNDLTYLLLDCHDTMRLAQPTLTARVHRERRRNAGLLQRRDHHPCPAPAGRHEG
jgi:formate C-acetyltransferase